MAKRIIFKNPDGTLGIIVPMSNSGLTIEQVAAKDVPPGLPFKIVEENKIPTDRTFRAAWIEDPSDTITCDMVKARDIHRDYLRSIRVGELAKLDIEFRKAKTQPDRDAVEEKAQVLRDITSDPIIEAAQNIEQLKLAIPLPLQAAHAVEEAKKKPKG